MRQIHQQLEPSVVVFEETLEEVGNLSCLWCIEGLFHENFDRLV